MVDDKKEEIVRDSGSHDPLRKFAQMVGFAYLTLRGTDLGTEVGLGRHAKDAGRLVALRRVGGDDMVTNGDREDAFTNAFHDATSFVSQNGREEAFRIVSVEGVNVSVTQGVGNDLDTHFPGLGRVDGDGLFHHGRLGSAGDESFARNGLGHVS
jgi:hypothetical protein